MGPINPQIVTVLISPTDPLRSAFYRVSFVVGLGLLICVWLITLRTYVCPVTCKIAELLQLNDVALCPVFGSAAFIIAGFTVVFRWFSVLGLSPPPPVMSQLCGWLQRPGMQNV